MKIFYSLASSIYIVLLTFLTLTDPAIAQNIIDIEDKTSSYQLGGSKLKLLEDKDKSLTIDDILSDEYSDNFQKNEQNVINLGFTSSAYWIQFTINNSLPEEKALLLEVAYALLDYISLFSPKSDGGYYEKQYGQYVLFNKREVKHRNFVFKITLPPECSHTFYLRIETEDSFTVPMKLYTQDEFVNKERADQVILGFFYGTLTIMMLYNLFIYSSVKDQNYLYLVLFILSFIVYILSENGLAYEYLWPGLPWWSKRAVPFAVSMVMITSSLFVQRFIETKRHAPRLDRAVFFFRVLGVIGILASLFAKYFYSIIFIVLLIILYSPVLMAAGYFCMRKGNRSAKYFLSAWVFLLVGAVAYGLKAFGILPEMFITKYGVPMGASIQMALLSLGLADKINIMRKELEILNLDLEEKVQDRTKNLIKANTSLKVEIADRKQVEKEKSQLQTQLQRAQKMEAIGNLAGGIAHDLNNILSGIVSYPDVLLLDMSQDNPLRKPILTIKKSGEKAASIVQDLLAMARRGVAVRETTDLNNIISDYLKSPEYQRMKLYHPGVHVKTNLETKLFKIFGSSIHMTKTVMNLVSNAAEAMPDGGEILISTENQYIDAPIGEYEKVEKGEYVVLSVHDSGMGIAQKDLDKIFEPFYTKKVMGRSGTGLGMAVVWGTIRDHNGYIDIQSIEGDGTTFILYFPVTRNESENQMHLLSIDDYLGNEESVLVVDDVEEQREIASIMLRRLNYSVASVASGEEAIDYLKDNSVDLLLLDMIMDPGIDGLDTYRQILKLHPKQKVIIASGFSETDRVKEIQKLGAKKYIKKPYMLRDIGLAIKNELGK